MNKNDFKLVKNMVRRLDIMIAKERDKYLRSNLGQAAGALTTVLWEKGWDGE